jgi:hypothetical protein
MHYLDAAGVVARTVTLTHVRRTVG